MKPIGKGLLVEFINVRESKSGIFRSHTWRVWQAAKVKEIGDEVKGISKGDIVFIRRFRAVRIGGEDLIFTQEGNVPFKSNKPKFIYTIKTQR